MKRVRSFLRCSSDDRRLLVKAACVLALVRLALWLLPSPTILRSVARVQTRALVPNGMDQETALRIGWAVEKAARYIPRATCLPRALATQVLLRRYGLNGTLRIGVAKGSGGA